MECNAPYMVTNKYYEVMLIGTCNLLEAPHNNFLSLWEKAVQYGVWITLCVPKYRDHCS